MPLHEQRRVPAVDDPVVEARREVHHLARHELAAPSQTGRTAILLTPTIATSGWLITGVVTMPPSAPSEVMVMVEPESSSRRRGAGARGVGEPVHLGGAVPEIARLGVAHHRHDQSPAGVCVAMPIWTPPC